MRKAHPLGLAALCFILLASSGVSSGSWLFRGRRDFPATGDPSDVAHPRSVAVIPYQTPPAGGLRAACGNAALGTVTVHNVNEHGELSADEKYVLPGDIRDIAFDYIDSDDLCDLVVLWNCLEGGHVTILFATAYGDFDIDPPGGPAEYEVGDDPQAVASDHFNAGDPYVDLIVANAGSHDVTVLLNDGTGVFPEALQSTCNIGGQPRDVALGDVNRDRLIDAVVADESGGLIRVLRNSGNSTRPFSAGFTQEFAVGGQPQGVAVDDFNRDRSRDIACTTGDVDADGEGKIIVLLNNGSGNFPDNLKTEYVAGRSTRSVVSGDLNGDGYADIAATGQRVEIAGDIEENVFVLLNSGAAQGGSFEDALSYGVRRNPRAICLGKLDGDDHLDALVGYGPQLGVSAYEDRLVSVLLGNGDGTLQGTGGIRNGDWSFGVEIQDVNSDSLPDLLVSRFFAGQVAVFLGDGWGSFGEPIVLETEDSPEGVEAAYLDTDGYIDLVVACGGDPYGCVSIHYGSDIGCWSGDVLVIEESADGLGAHPTDIEVADFDEDGLPDIAVACEAASVGGSGACILWGADTGNGPFNDCLQLPEAWSTDAGCSVEMLCADDIDNDGHVDLVAAENNEQSSTSPEDGLHVFLGPFLPNVPHGPPGGADGYSSTCSSDVYYRVQDVDLVDLNDDALLDAAVACTHDGLEGVAVYLASSGREMSYPDEAEGFYQTAGEVFHVQFGDFDADGHPDIAAPIHYYSYEVAVFRGLGYGSFDPDPHFYGCAYWPTRIAVGELDPLADSSLDMAVVHEQGRSGEMDDVQLFFGLAEPRAQGEVRRPPLAPSTDAAVELRTVPNPFGEQTRISFVVPRNAMRVRVFIHDVAGRCVKTLVDEVFPEGEHEARWDGNDDEGRSVASGVYFCTSVVGDSRSTRKTVLLR